MTQRTNVGHGDDIIGQWSTLGSRRSTIMWSYIPMSPCSLDMFIIVQIYQVKFLPAFQLNRWFHFLDLYHVKMIYMGLSPIVTTHSDSSVSLWRLHFFKSLWNTFFQNQTKIPFKWTMTLNSWLSWNYGKILFTLNRYIGSYLFVSYKTCYCNMFSSNAQ